ncbi:MAG: sirohydrochlorin chelatase [Rhodospirillaceae bacterium]|jgi:sirohydrochlorin cobaltochelatase|nr:MAG: sirohydrochlorin chelatase [Rhodospirillaceae bacterium]PPR74406.1 MAG: Sirohydrochlorin cobaltochelatase [Alphaproteobacteria bacterium MarineAlpha3_Bin2]HIM77920.1 sirohydrochlorin chelatase [Rhodospirillales bacterium]
MTDKTAVMICGHGSRDDHAIEEFNKLAGHLSRRLPQFDVESGFLEFATPIIRTGLDKLKERGANKIVCVPGMLFAAGHVKNDLPSEVNNFGAENPGIEMIFGRELAVDQKLLEAARQRIEEAENEAATDVDRKDTLLMVVGRGTNDPDANSNVSKVARMLWEGMGFGWAEVSYSGVAYPLVDTGLKNAVKLGYRRIIVFPYFLFTGILVRRIYDWVDEAATNHPEVEILKASYLNDHELLIDTFVERVEEALTGDNAMNCQLCKYREQIIGYEGDVGAAQVGHHHHVRGVGTDGHDAHDHGVHGHHHHHED